MLKRIVLCMALSFPLYADHCQLVSDAVPRFVQHVGTLRVDYIDSTSITFNDPDNDISSKFNMDYLHNFAQRGKEFSFRFHWYFHYQGKTTLINVTWLDNKVPSSIFPGMYTFFDYQVEKLPVKGRTMVIIGDSITWSMNGRYLRCMLINQGIDYDFIGEHVDTFGFAHDAEGGDTTQAVINRMATIPSADAYFILLGTNDWALSLTPMQTVNNLMTIANAMKVKNPNAIIYISTLLPRSILLQRNLDVNALLKAGKWPDNIRILDVGGFIYEQPNWSSLFDSDELHPNYNGYTMITKKIIHDLSSDA